MGISRHILGAGALATLVVSGLLALRVAGEDAPSSSQSAVCPPDEPTLDRYRYLRALSLDLRGEIPEMSELEALESVEDVPVSTVDAYLADPGFAERVLGLHRDLLWPNLSAVDIYNFNAFMDRSDDLYYRRNMADEYRGLAVPCLSQPVEYLTDGSIKTYVQEDGSRREGYVEVKPYWDPSTTLKVCAFDAQTPSVSPSGTACDTVDAYDDVGCGCGPELRWCTTSSAQDKVLAGFEDDLEKRVDAVISNHQSYLELFTGRTGWVNGPIVYYLKYQSKLYGDSRLSPLPLDASRLPDLAFTDETTWKAVELGEEQAGILTAPGFLLRFMTNRARANRFYTYFLCQPFQPPEDGLPAPGESEPILDLQVRDGCKYCHAILEPAASYWGRWTESGAGYLPAEDYPPLDDGCQQCALTGSGCTDDCRRYYVSRALTEEEEPWLGMLRTYAFRDEEHYSNIEVGPRLLASRSVEDDRLPSCVSSTAVRWLLGRDPLEEEQAWIDELSLHFIQSNYDYSSLVREIVTSGVYRRVE